MNLRGRRIVILSLTTGLAIAVLLNVLYNLAVNSGSIEDHRWLALSQAPGRLVGDWLARELYSPASFPWNVRLAVTCAYLTLVFLWTILVLLLCQLVRAGVSLFRSSKSTWSR